MIAAAASSADELPWWLELTLVAIVVTAIAGFFGGWSGIWKTWAVIVGLLLLGLVLTELEESPDEHCEYDRFGNGWCWEASP
ncbi:MAG: hypothetical protein AB7Q27_11665 [Acidimicrobiia bacterium]